MLPATRTIPLILLLLVPLAAPAPTTTDEVTSSVFMPLTELTDAQGKAKGAVCLDGSNPGFYHRRSPTNSTGWVVYFKGGGWCKSPADCASRSRSELGSSSK